MSYCRFSTNNFECDLYCYQSDEGYVTHVARIKTRPGTARPVPGETMDKYLGRLSESTVEIGLPFDGVTFTDETLEDFEARLRMLRETGYRFPDSVFDMIREERLDDQAKNAWVV